MLEKMSSMMFVEQTEQYLNDDVINIIETMVNHHVSKNYKDVRNIILGYNSKTREWKSKYGESLQKKTFRILEQEQFIHTSLSDSNSDKFIKNQGMTFYDDDIYDITRIYTDDVVKRILDLFFTISKNVIEYKHIIDIIITEWNIKNKVVLNRDDIKQDTYGSIHLRPIEVRETAWKEFKSICRYRKVIVRDGFKQAIITFLEDRAEMTRYKY